ncbi:MAG: hypothetical protein LBG28_12920, partial [Tannerella sp.]|nr:hypothetical protein [Tannerella sp.]
MKKIVFTLSTMLACMTGVNAQVSSTLFHQKDAFETYPALKTISADVPVKQMPEVNVEELLAEDEELAGLDVPFRFGYGFDVSYTLDDGHWTLSDDVNVWDLKVASSGAYSLNFIFDRLSLAGGAELYIYSTDGSMVYGPVTSADNLPGENTPSASDFSSLQQQEESGRLFLTDLVAGDEVIIRLVEPANVPGSSYLRISKVVHGYVNTFPSLNENELSAATLSCHNDVACYSNWTDESDAVALVLLASGDA